MLVKKKCFVCNAPAAKMCTGCQCACFCSKDCQTKGWKQHKKLCKLVKAADVVVDNETFQIEL